MKQGYRLRLADNVLTLLPDMFFYHYILGNTANLLQFVKSQIHLVSKTYSIGGPKAPPPPPPISFIFIGFSATNLAIQ